MGPLDAADTHDLSISQYQLSVDTGGTTSPQKLITNGIFLQGLWEAYRWTVGAGVAVINLTLQMQWVEWIVDAVNPLAITLKRDVVDRLGVLQLSLAAMAVWVTIIAAVGRYARAISQLVISTALAALATGVLANPVAAITGPDGLLYTARDAGQAVATLITSNGQRTDPDPDLIGRQTGAALVDTFIRAPHQMINYGQVIDGTSCQQTYDEALAGGPYDSDDDSARSALGDCDEALKEFADDPGWSGVAAIAILTPAGGALVVLAIVLSVLVLLAVLTTLFYAVKLLIDLPLAIAGGERAGLWSSLTSLLGALLLTAASLVLLAIYCLVLRAVLAADGDTELLARFLVVDAMVIAFIATTLGARKRIAERARTLAHKAARFSGGGKAQPVKMPGLAQVRQVAGQVAATRTAMGRLAGGTASNSTPGHIQSQAAAGAGASGRGGRGAGAGNPLRRNAAARVAQRLGNNRLIKTGLSAASLAGGAAGLAAKATLGAPVYGPRATRMVKAAASRRAASARAAVGKKVADGKAFAAEYHDGLALVARPAAAAGRAAAGSRAGQALTRSGASAARAATQAAASATTAAAITLSTPTGPSTGGGGPVPPRPPASSSTRNAVSNAPRRAAQAQRRRLREQAEHHRASQIPTTSASSDRSPVPSSQSAGASAPVAQETAQKPAGEHGAGTTAATRVADRLTQRRPQ
ncbi:hypothetical protein [Kineococcus sp. SYSU DK003]|uniref:hypothetical protein n=1 Tax=Kineococcus sp. SYSU DK003 TaxID=3383124 RepID=UPI003D7E3F9E